MKKEAWREYLLFGAVLLPVFKPVGLCLQFPVMDTLYDAGRAALFLLMLPVMYLRLRDKKERKPDLCLAVPVYQAMMALGYLLAGTLLRRAGAAVSCTLAVWAVWWLAKRDRKRLIDTAAVLLCGMLAVHLALTLVLPQGLNGSQVPEGRIHFLGKDNTYIWWALTAFYTMHLRWRIRRNKAEYGVFLAGVTLTLLLGSSTTGTAIWLLVLAVLAARRWLPVLKQLTFARVTAALAALNVALVVLQVQKLLSGVIHFFTGKDATLSDRVYIWDTMKRLFLEKPVFGNGTGEAAIDAWKQWGDTVLYAHNLVLDILVKGGLAAFAGFALVLWVWNRDTKRRTGAMAARWGMALLVLAAFGIAGLMEGFEDAAIFWVFLALSCFASPAAGKKAKRREAVNESNDQPDRPGL